MLYSILKFAVRLEMKIFCRHIEIKKPEYLHSKGPLLLAFNHPNSFLDAILIDILFDEPVWSLARGDAFKGERIKKILHGLCIMPVYRTSEGVENLSENYKTFNDCINIFKNNGLVQIFSEGLCVNEWHLRPLKKGTARLAIKAWEENVPLKVLPLGINYSSFKKFGKNVVIQFGEPITREDIDITAPDGVRNQAFNNKLQQQLQELIYEIPKDDRVLREKLLVRKPSLLEKILLFLPGMLGVVLNAPLYLPVRNFVKKKTRKTVHYDSVMLGLLLLTYPVYLILWALIIGLVFKTFWALAVFLVFPFTAWCYVRIKKQIE